MICALVKFDNARLASSCDDMTIKPLRLEELSTVARITQCTTVPYLENRAANSPLKRRLGELPEWEDDALCEGKRETKDIEVSTVIHRAP